MSFTAFILEKFTPTDINKTNNVKALLLRYQNLSIIYITLCLLAMTTIYLNMMWFVFYNFNANLLGYGSPPFIICSFVFLKKTED